MTIRTLHPGDVLQLAHFGRCTVADVLRDPKTKELHAYVRTADKDHLTLSLRYASRRLPQQ